MLGDMELGYITTVIVKDMSRLGRDYLQVGYYTDTFFPEMNIRFIAVNDYVDSNEGENEFSPFRNVMNVLSAIRKFIGTRQGVEIEYKVKAG